MPALHGDHQRSCRRLNRASYDRRQEKYFSTKDTKQPAGVGRKTHIQTLSGARVNLRVRRGRLLFLSSYSIEMRRLLDNWPKLVFILLPLCIATVDAAVLIHERRQPDTEKAIRLVRESNSRKENFTIQQYLYSTVFHRQRLGQRVEIDGWRAHTSPAPAHSITVEFSYRDSLGPYVATWEADLQEGRVTPLNDAARDLSWH